MGKIHTAAKVAVRLAIIERKCRSLLSDIIELRSVVESGADIDSVIDKLHKAARRMKEQSAWQRRTLTRRGGVD